MARIVGIDLGTTNSLVAYMKDGKPCVIPGRSGRSMVPSVVAMTDNGLIVGQLPDSADQKEQLGLLLAKDSPLTQCVTGAVDALREDGTLAKLETEWLANQGAPVLAP